MFANDLVVLADESDLWNLDFFVFQNNLKIINSFGDKWKDEFAIFIKQDFVRDFVCKVLGRDFDFCARAIGEYLPVDLTSSGGKI